MTIDDSTELEKEAISKAIHDVIGWALTKDFDLLFSIVAQDASFFIFHPDSASTIIGFDAFRSFAERSWKDPSFRATRFEIRELRICLSTCGTVAWYSCFLDDFGEKNGLELGWSNVRWTGVVEKREGRWVHTQMHFSFPTDR
ncbi:MAG: nuclear transport factor 2 family protein [Candidatus Eiseniibacteriota bacterium]|nr:MAG: nuclear transport factor 2 family protein [Candidatus Eisenbacteria bacterium]